MNLPLVIDVVIGLLGIYFILSLLASEIQELLATLFQWRAAHLKRAIEQLLIGHEPDPGDRKFVDDLYNSPLINSLNQQATNGIAAGFRHVVNACLERYRALTHTRNLFGQQRSAPSYIPPETFAIALLQTVQINALSRKIGELTLRQFQQETITALHDIVEDLRVSIGNDPFLIGDGSLLERELKQLEQTLDEAISACGSRRTSLTQGLAQITAQITAFIDNTKALLTADHNDHPCKTVIRQRLEYLKHRLCHRQLEPTMTDVLEALLAESAPYSLPDAFDAPDRGSQHLSDDLTKHQSLLAPIITQLQRDTPELKPAIETLPGLLKRNLLSLSEQARLNAESLEAEVRQLEREVGEWFKHSMERASGVYRRNAKGVALLIGFLLAVTVNADTLHMVDHFVHNAQLSASDQVALSEVVSPEVVSPEAISPETPDPNSLPLEPPVPGESTPVPISIPSQPDPAEVNQNPLPIGWNAVNLEAQNRRSQSWAFPLLRCLLGWSITGMALAMGANFWFNLMDRVIHVRSTGRKPDRD